MLDKLALFADKYDMLPPGSLILAAVSGGADSMCLLTALIELSEKRCFTVAAAHFNHQLRGDESERDARFVEAFCQVNNIRLYSGCGDVGAYARHEGLGIEEAARKMRYDFFYEAAKNIDAKRIATAHTADDNAETILLNLARGAGLKGLSGIPPKRGLIIRPMLTVTRTDIIDFLSQRDISFVEDSSNSLDIYSRNMIRHHIIPVLRKINPRLTEHISASSELIRADDEYLNGIADKYIQDNCHGDAHGARALNASELAGLPKSVSSRVIRLIYGNNLSSAHISAVLALCASTSMSGEVMLPSGSAFREYTRIVFSHGCQTAGFAPVGLTDGSSAVIPELGLTIKYKRSVLTHAAQMNSMQTDLLCSEKINKSFTTFLFKYDSICDKIVIRPRETGDKINLFGRNGTKTLKKLFIEQHIPLRKRSLVPVIADSNGVLAVYGIGIDERAACQTGDQVLEIIFEETPYEK